MPSRDDQVKARLAHNMGTATEVMDARAQAAQNMARIAEVQLSSAPAAAPSNYDQLAVVDRHKKKRSETHWQSTERTTCYKKPVLLHLNHRLKRRE